MPRLSVATLAILSLALGARVAVAVFAVPQDRTLYPDERDYVAVARSLVAGEGFLVGGEDSLRAPLFPLVLAGTWCVTGESLLAARAMQAVLGAMLVLATLALAREATGSERAARAAALLVALEPWLSFFSGLLLSETIACLLVLLVAWALFAAVARPDRARAAGLAGGAAAGLLALARPSFLLLWPFAAALALAFSRERRRLAPSFGLGVAAFALVLAPWTARNGHVHGAFVPVTPALGSNLYEVNHPDATGGPLRDTIVWPEESRGLSAVETDRVLRRLAFEWMLDHPADALRLAAVKVARTWSPWPNEPALRQRPAIVAASALAWLPLAIFAPIGIAVAVRRRLAAAALALPPLYVALVHAVFMGSVRYRLPAVAVLAVLAGLGLQESLGWLVARRASGNMLRRGDGA